MIFWGRSLFDFFRHLPYDIAIFWCRCANFFFFRPTTKLHGAREAGQRHGDPPLRWAYKGIFKHSSMPVLAPANRGDTETQPHAPPALAALSSSGAAGSTSLRDNRPRRLLKDLKDVLCTMYYVLCTMYYVLCTMYYVLCTMYYVLCTMYCVLCTMYCVLCTM